MANLSEEQKANSTAGRASAKMSREGKMDTETRQAQARAAEKEARRQQ